MQYARELVLFYGMGIGKDQDVFRDPDIIEFEDGTDQYGGSVVADDQGVRQVARLI